MIQTRMEYNPILLATAYSLLTLLGLPACSEGLRCYQCKESIGCFRDPTKVIQECGEDHSTVCVAFTTFDYVRFARRGCISEQEYLCYLFKETFPIESNDPNALVTISNEDYLDCYNSNKPNTTSPDCPSACQTDENETANRRYTIHACETDLCNHKPLPGCDPNSPCFRDY